jgi:hypothetical protein
MTVLQERVDLSDLFLVYGSIIHNLLIIGYLLVMTHF